MCGGGYRYYLSVSISSLEYQIVRRISSYHHELQRIMSCVDAYPFRYSVHYVYVIRDVTVDKPD
jgi:hypothetical protein